MMEKLVPVVSVPAEMFPNPLDTKWILSVPVTKPEMESPVMLALEAVWLLETAPPADVAS